MNIQIYNIIWHFMLTFGTLKVLWIFMFIVITVFFVIMYSSGRDELKKYILSNNTIAEKITPLEFTESMNDTLHVLSKKLSEREHMLKESKCQIKNAERVLNDIEIRNEIICERYRTLMNDLKNDLIRIVEEVKILQNEVTNLFQRQEDLRNNVLKQQKEYQQMLAAFIVELEDKNNNHEKPRCGSRKFGIVTPRIVPQLSLSPTTSEIDW